MGERLGAILAADTVRGGQWGKVAAEVVADTQCRWRRYRCEDEAVGDGVRDVTAQKMANP